MKNCFIGLVSVVLCCAVVFPACGADVALVVGSDITSFATAEKGVKNYLAHNGQPDIDVFEVAKDSDYLAKVRAKKYKVICVLGSNPFKKIRDVVKDTPLVFSMVLNPVESGVVPSLAPSGRNFTGFSLDVPSNIQLELLKRIVPDIKNVGVFYTVKSETVVDAGITAQDGLGLTLIAKKVSAATDIPEALRSIGPVDALWVVPDTAVCTKDTLPLFLNFASEKKIPALVFADFLVKAGALAAYTYDYADIGAQTGEIVLRVINGENAGTISVVAPRKTGYIINTKTAKSLGLNISSSVLRSAEQLFE